MNANVGKPFLIRKIRAIRGPVFLFRCADRDDRYLGRDQESEWQDACADAGCDEYIDSRIAHMSGRKLLTEHRRRNRRAKYWQPHLTAVRVAGEHYFQVVRDKKFTGYDRHNVGAVLQHD